MQAEGGGRFFDGISERYDLLNRVMSLGLDQGWRRKLVAALGEAPRRVLDLATGTADVAVAIAKAHPDAAVVGLDPSRGMLQQGVSAAFAACRVCSTLPALVYQRCS